MHNCRDSVELKLCSTCLNYLASTAKNSVANISLIVSVAMQIRIVSVGLEGLQTLLNATHCPFVRFFAYV